MLTSCLNCISDASNCQQHSMLTARFMYLARGFRRLRVTVHQWLHMLHTGQALDAVVPLREASPALVVENLPILQHVWLLSSTKH